MRKILDQLEAEACLAAVAASGLSRSAWAHRQGIDARSLNAWRLNLERGSAAPDEGPGLRVVELVPKTVPRSNPQYAVRYGDFVVEVGEDFDERVLGRLLGVVARC